MGREINIEEGVMDHAEKRGWLVRKIAYLGRRNAPDRWFFRKRKACPCCGSTLDIRVLEIKQTGKPARLGQVREISRLRNSGVPAFVVDDLEQGCALLD